MYHEETQSGVIYETFCPFHSFVGYESKRSRSYAVSSSQVVLIFCSLPIASPLLHTGSRWRAHKLRRRATADGGTRVCARARVATSSTFTTTPQGARATAGRRRGVAYVRALLCARANSRLVNVRSRPPSASLSALSRDPHGCRVCEHHDQRRRSPLTRNHDDDNGKRTRADERTRASARNAKKNVSIERLNRGDNELSAMTTTPTTTTIGGLTQRSPSRVLVVSIQRAS